MTSSQAKLATKPALAVQRNATVLDDFLKLASRRSEDPAIASYLAGRPDPVVLSYGEIAGLVDKLALKLLELGVAPKEFVSFQFPNRWEFAIAHLATLRVGASSNPIMPIYGKREIRSMLDRTQSRVCIGLTHYRGKPTLLTEIGNELQKLQHLLLIDDECPERSLVSQLENIKVDREARDRLERLRPQPDDIDTVMFSSGTTGEPKGVLHSHRSSYLAISNSFARMEMRENDTILMFSPVGHATGFNYGLEMPLFLGCKFVFQELWDPEETLRIIERERVTWTMGSSAFVSDLCDVAERTSFDTSSLRYFACGGAPIPPQLVGRAEGLIGAQLIPCWGMTEVGMATVGKLTDSAERKVSTDGCALDGVQIRVVDDDGEPVPVGTPGHLQLRATGQHIGYFQNEELFKASFQDGWYKTGDLGKLDASGYVRILGRSKELVIRGGENVPVIEIENILRELPEIADIVIVGVPDNRLGERCHAVVIPSAPGNMLNLGHLTNYLAKHEVTKQFWPEFLSVRETLPRTATGKIQRFLIRDQLVANGNSDEV